MLNFRIKKTPKEISLGVVGLLGLEPRTTEPKSAVLPLHHRPICFKERFASVLRLQR